MSDEPDEIDDDGTGEHEAPREVPEPDRGIFAGVAALLRAKGHRADAVTGGGGLPVIAVAAGQGAAWQFGAHPDAHCWAGDYYVGGSYYDSKDVKGVTTECADARAIADGIARVLGEPPGAEAEAEWKER